MSDEVWVVESGDYENRGIVLVADSLESAVGAVKTLYEFPYIVRWEDVGEDEVEGGVLVGHFDAVLHYSTKHTAEYEVSRYDVAHGVTEEDK